MIKKLHQQYVGVAFFIGKTSTVKVIPEAVKRLSILLQHASPIVRRLSLLTCQTLVQNKKLASLLSGTACRTNKYNLFLRSVKTPRTTI